MDNFQSIAVKLAATPTAPLGPPSVGQPIHAPRERLPFDGLAKAPRAVASQDAIHRSVVE